MVVFEWGEEVGGDQEPGLGWLWPKAVEPPLEGEREAWGEAALETSLLKGGGKSWRPWPRPTKSGLSRPGVSSGGFGVMGLSTP
eukprot:4656374-Alexandrium_andersonii.AAC.1